jgi:hypothetical protein
VPRSAHGESDEPEAEPEDRSWKPLRGAVEPAAELGARAPVGELLEQRRDTPIHPVEVRGVARVVGVDLVGRR